MEKSIYIFYLVIFRNQQCYLPAQACLEAAAFCIEGPNKSYL